MEALTKHREAGRAGGGLQARRVARAEREVEAIVLAGLRRRIGDLRADASLTALAQQVASGTLDPYAAADIVVAELL